MPDKVQVGFIYQDSVFRAEVSHCVLVVPIPDEENDHSYDVYHFTNDSELVSATVALLLLIYRLGLAIRLTDELARAGHSASIVALKDDGTEAS